MSLTSQGSQPPGLLMPILVVNHFHRSRPKLRLCPWEPLASSQTGVNQPPVGADRNPPRARADSRPPPARAERPQHPSKVESHPLPARAVSRPPQVGASPQQPQEVLPTVPRVEEEQATVPELTGSKCTCARPRVGSLNPQCLRTQLGWQKRGERPLVTFMIEWPEKNHPRITSPLGP